MAQLKQDALRYRYWRKWGVQWGDEDIGYTLTKGAELDAFTDNCMKSKGQHTNDSRNPSNERKSSAA
jgi:hypothetical protein